LLQEPIRAVRDLTLIVTLYTLHWRCSNIDAKRKMRPRVIIPFQTAVIAVTLITAAAAPAQSAPDWTSALSQAARAAPEARIVILDRHDGRIVATRHLQQAARTLAAPGSTLKPLILYKLLASGRWDPEHRVACRRTLVIAGHRLACSHPPSPPFNAKEALAWSCNSYFAEVARSLGIGELGALLSATGVMDATSQAANEAIAEFREPRSVEEAQLTLLGIESIRITPLGLATAYRRLANEIGDHSDTPAAATVQAGLADSTEFGMAQPASHGVVSVAGKTGTAESAGSHRTHGWFAGFAPARDPQVVIVVYVPSGRGADAAHVAGMLLAHAPLEARRP
jgi:cell division protein FtsI/penicillin-binding protein 2